MFNIKYILLKLRRINISLSIGLSISVHFISVLILYLLSYKLGWINNVPNDFTLIRWDAVWYREIMTNGYSYLHEEQNSMAFFPLFSAMWETLSVGGLGISFINLIIFYYSYFVLARKLEFSFDDSLLWLTTPILFFCSVPYSEALFFMGCTFLLVGLDNNDKRFTILGLIIASSTRSVGMVFIPILIFTYLITTKNITFKSASICFLNIFVIVSVTMFVFLLQYIHTGEWFVFFETQKAWNRRLQFPTLPFTSSSEIEVIVLDLIALFVGFTALSYTAYIALIQCLQKNKIINYAQSFIFSMSYLSLITMVSIFYSGIWEGDSGTKLMSLPRFIFATPFFIYFASSNKIKWGKITVFIITLIILTFLCYVNSIFNHPFLILFFCSYIFLYLFKHNVYLKYSLIIINIVLQILLFDRFLSEYWIS